MEIELNITYELQKPFLDMTEEERAALFVFIKENCDRGVVVVLGLDRCAFCGSPLGAPIGGRALGQGKPGLITNLCHKCFLNQESILG